MKSIWVGPKPLHSTAESPLSLSPSYVIYVVFEIVSNILYTLRSGSAMARKLHERALPKLTS